MKNLISTIYTDNTHSDDAKLVLRLLINALTGATCSTLMQHYFKVQRGEAQTPTLDERNEFDEKIRGMEVEEFLTMSNGFEPNMPLFKQAQICDGIRVSLYRELQRYVELADEKYLYVEQPKSKNVLARPNYDQPFSAQFYLDFRVESSGKVRETEVKAIAANIDEPEDFVRAAMAENAIKLQERMREAAPYVLTELQSFDDVYDEGAFLALPMDMQIKIAEKVSEKLSAEYRRLISFALRDLDAAVRMKMVKALHAQVSAWCQEADAELRAAVRMAEAA